MNRTSKTNTYYDTMGNKYTQAQVDRYIRQAKAQKIQQMQDEYGYVFCEECGRNDCLPVDCSHDLPVKKCKETRQVELAWDVNNITMRGRPCHAKHDKLY